MISNTQWWIPDYKLNFCHESFRFNISGGYLTILNAGLYFLYAQVNVYAKLFDDSTFYQHNTCSSTDHHIYRQDCREAASCRGIKFTHRPKISIFAPQERFVTPIYVKLGTAERHVGPLGRAKFRANRWIGVGTRLPKVENFHFLVDSPRMGEPFDRFLQLLGAFIRPTTLH